MILLALDTCDARGSLAILRDEQVLTVVTHGASVDYSLWVLPAAEQAFSATGLSIRDVELFAAASGPGSFTAVRIALATVKAWSEVYGRPIVGVSRLEAMAALALDEGQLVAAFVDAHRDQVFGGLYRRHGVELSLVEQQLVVPPGEFVDWVNQRSGDARVAWISLDPEKVTALETWQSRAKLGEEVETCTTVLAPGIGRIGRLRALQGRVIDALSLDAEYVRRPDAELFSKQKVGHGS